MIEVKLQRITQEAIIPDKAYTDAAGYDLYSVETVTLEPGARALIHTGWNIQLPEAVEAQVRPKSGLALKYGITVLNSPGTIDADYRGEIAVILINHGSEPYRIEKGSKIAQLVISNIARAKISEVSSLDRSERGAQGFGSSGRF